MFEGVFEMKDDEEDLDVDDQDGRRSDNCMSVCGVCERRTSWKKVEVEVEEEEDDLFCFGRRQLVVL